MFLGGKLTRPFLDATARIALPSIATIFCVIPGSSNAADALGKQGSKIIAQGKNTLDSELVETAFSP